jgi:hypothetical protein
MDWRRRRGPASVSGSAGGPTTRRFSTRNNPGREIRRRRLRFQEAQHAVDHEGRLRFLKESDFGPEG